MRFLLFHLNLMIANQEALSAEKMAIEEITITKE